MTLSPPVENPPESSGGWRRKLPPCPGGAGSPGLGSASVGFRLRGRTEDPPYPPCCTARHPSQHNSSSTHQNFTLIHTHLDLVEDRGANLGPDVVHKVLGKAPEGDAKEGAIGGQQCMRNSGVEPREAKGGDQGVPLSPKS